MTQKLSGTACKRHLNYKAGCTITSYYYFNGQRVATRLQSDANPTGVVTWLHGDMLGSTSVATDAGGNKIAGSGLPTDRRFIPQRAALARDMPPPLSLFSQPARLSLCQ